MSSDCRAQRTAAEFLTPMARCRPQRCRRSVRLSSRSITWASSSEGLDMLPSLAGRAPQKATSGFYPDLVRERVDWKVAGPITALGVALAIGGLAVGGFDSASASSLLLNPRYRSHPDRIRGRRRAEAGTSGEASRRGRRSPGR